jgi:hypothetical protein
MKGSNTMETKNSFVASVVRILLGTGLILSIPLVAMQFSREVDWNAFDFTIIGILLIGTGSVYEFIIKKVKNPNTRAILAVALGAALFLTWAELAVGIFGTPFAGS